MFLPVMLRIRAFICISMHNVSLGEQCLSLRIVPAMNSILDFITHDRASFYYTLSGLAFLGLTLRPALERKIYFNIPFLYILIGGLAAALSLPIINPLGSQTETKIIAHASEMIVIIALTGAGLAIDLPASWKNWRSTWRLLIITMPITMLGISLVGIYALSLPLATAVLLATSLASTDPVMARSVQVGPPNSDQTGESTALTAEAGLNDGLSFPFVYFAIGLVGISMADFNWAEWFGYYLFYKIFIAVLIGFGFGWILTKFIFSPIGDANSGRAYPALVVLGSTFLAYGLTEILEGYGFLAVFLAARSGRRLSEDTDAEPYEKAAHHSADQLESILLAVLLLWFGAFVGTYMLQAWTWSDLLFALFILFILRPIAGMLGLIGVGCEAKSKFQISFFGIRGMGTIFYIAYAMTVADFQDIDVVWRIASLTIVLSTLIHGCLATQWMNEEHQTPAKPENA